MSLHPDDMVGVLQDMIAMRVQSKRLWNLQRQGRIGTFPPGDGHEATVLGATIAMDPEIDWIFPQYRELLGLRSFGEEILARYCSYLIGHPSGGHMPEPIRVAPPSISLATQIPHAVGFAWGMAHQRQPGAALVFFGDGSSSEGDFYEAGNLAGVRKAPVIFLCTNNQWAISTPVSKQTAASSFADKAQAFGFPGVKVDGTNLVEVHEAVAAARERAVGGLGPTLIEAELYRLNAHTTADDPTRYVPEEDLEAAKAADPIDLLRDQLVAMGRWDDAMTADAEREALARFDEAFEWATSQSVDFTELFDQVFAEPTPRLQQQRARYLESTR